MENPNLKWFKIDDDWGFPSHLGNPQILLVFPENWKEKLAMYWPRFSLRKVWSREDVIVHQSGKNKMFAKRKRNQNEVYKVLSQFLRVMSCASMKVKYHPDHLSQSRDCITLGKYPDSFREHQEIQWILVSHARFTRIGVVHHKNSLSTAKLWARDSWWSHQL